MKSTRVFAAAVLLAASCLLPQGAYATNLNEPPFYGQLRECHKSAQTYGATFLKSCVAGVCATSRPCVEESCRMAGRIGPAWEPCVREGMGFAYDLKSQ